MKQNESIVLVTINGKDAPGIVSAMTQVIARANIRILDIEQVVIHNTIILSILMDFYQDSAEQKPVLKELLFEAKRLNLNMDFSVLSDSDFSLRSTKSTYAITCVGEDISAQVLAKISSTLAKSKVNIEKIGKLSEGKLKCVEMIANAASEAGISQLRKELLHLSSDYPVDISLQKENIYRKAKRLVIMDLDSTLIQMEIIDELAKLAGVGDEVANITRACMGGELDFTEALIKRVWLLKGIPLETLQQVYDNLQLMPGAKKLINILKKLGYKTGVISGGFDFFASRFKQELGLDYAFANKLQVRDGVLTGRVLEPIIDSRKKADLLEEIARKEAISLEQVIAIGDGANDLLMLERAGLGIAFNAQKKVREAASHSISQRNIDSILFLLGINEKDLADIG
jgi:phosphoserine phosphatase